MNKIERKMFEFLEKKTKEIVSTKCRNEKKIYSSENIGRIER